MKKVTISLTGALVAVALIGGGGFVAWKLMQRKAEPKPTSGTTPTTGNPSNGTTPPVSTSPVIPPNGNTGVVGPARPIKPPVLIEDPIMGIFPGENISVPAIPRHLDPVRDQLSLVGGAWIKRDLTPPINPLQPKDEDSGSVFNRIGKWPIQAIDLYTVKR